jgi:hypothetical protein
MAGRIRRAVVAVALALLLSTALAGPRAADIVPLAVVVLIAAACWAASVGVMLMYVLHAE